MDCHFMDNINLPNSHHFGLLDRIAPKLTHKIRKKNQGSRLPYKGLLTGRHPQNPKFHRLDPFFFFLF